MRDNPPRGRNRLSPKLLKTPTLLLSCPSSNAIVVGWVELWRGRVCECEWEMRRRMRCMAHSEHGGRAMRDRGPAMFSPSSRSPSPKPFLPPSFAKEVVKAAIPPTTPYHFRRASRRSFPFPFRLLAYRAIEPVVMRHALDPSWGTPSLQPSPLSSVIGRAVGR